MIKTKANTYHIFILITFFIWFACAGVAVFHHKLQRVRKRAGNWKNKTNKLKEKQCCHNVARRAHAQASKINSPKLLPYTCWRYVWEFGDTSRHYLFVITSFILITSLTDNVWILFGEISSWSLVTNLMKRLQGVWSACMWCLACCKEARGVVYRPRLQNQNPKAPSRPSHPLRSDHSRCLYSRTETKTDKRNLMTRWELNKIIIGSALTRSNFVLRGLRGLKANTETLVF